MEESQVRLFQIQAEICKSLADPKRLMLIHELRQAELSVTGLAHSLGLSHANVSQHLAVLRKRGIVSAHRQGTTVYYSLTRPKIGEACDLVREVLADQLHQNQELAGFLGLS